MRSILTKLEFLFLFFEMKKEKVSKVSK